MSRKSSRVWDIECGRSSLERTEETPGCKVVSVSKGSEWGALLFTFSKFDRTRSRRPLGQESHIRSSRVTQPNIGYHSTTSPTCRTRSQNKQKKSNGMKQFNTRMIEATTRERGKLDCFTEPTLPTINTSCLHQPERTLHLHYIYAGACSQSACPPVQRYGQPREACLHVNPGRLGTRKSTTQHTGRPADRQARRAFCIMRAAT